MGQTNEQPKSFKKLAAKLGKLVTEKNAAYGDSDSRAARMLLELFPLGIPAERYRSVLRIVRMFDKMSREATQPDVENWKDIAGYGLLGWRAALAEKRQLSGQSDKKKRGT